MIDLSLILPVHNEEDIIEKVTKEVKKNLNALRIKYEVILVENGSTDNSLKVLKRIASKDKRIKFLVAEKGYGSAVIKGLENAKGKHVSYMPSDGQVDLKLLKKLWKEMQKGQHHMVKVKRTKRENLLRDLTTWGLSQTISVLFGTERIDVNGSPRIFHKKHLTKLNLQAKDSFIDSEFLIKVSKLDWKIKELPMKNIERYGGKSTRSHKTYIEFFRNILKHKFFRRLN